MTNYVLLDIDGVFNPLGDLSKHPYCDTFFHFSRDWISWRISLIYHEMMFEEIINIGSNIVWASSWENSSNELANAMGFDDFPFILFSSKSYSNRTPHSWKFNDIKKFIESHPGDSFVWVDDEMTEADHCWAQENPEVLFLQTDPEIGYLESDQKILIDFLKLQKVNS